MRVIGVIPSRWGSTRFPGKSLYPICGKPLVQRAVIENRLALGQTAAEAVTELRRESVRTAMTPIINSLAVCGVVSLPGMMTGQILSGSDPLAAVRYQMMIMYLIASGAGFGSLLTIQLASRRLFDGRERLRLDRLSEEKG
jgi:putative ABC transport system permease protein